mmetsp:Transcript_15991/g.18075  ORF Transcript_15991/g.18075 Transcript_15991/m.18075 type:complete len:300 (+) Transcript_15991:155-1054(+)
MALTQKDKRLKDLDELLERVSAVKEQIPVEEKKKSKPEKDENLDPFESAKISFIQKLLAVKRNIQEIQDAKQKSSIKTHDQIAKQQGIRSEVKALNILYTNLEGIQGKERRKRRSKLTVEQLEERDNILRQFQAQLVALKTAITKGYANPDLSRDLERGIGIGSTQTTSMLNDAGIFSGNGAAYTPSSTGELTDDQKMKLDRISQRDAEFDKTLDAINSAVERAGDIAKQIGEEADKQNPLLEQMDEKVETVQTHMKTVNEKMKEQLVESGCGFERICINLMCFIVLMGIIGVLVNIAS